MKRNSFSPLPRPGVLLTLFVITTALCSPCDAFHEKGSDVITMTQSKWKEVEKSEFLWIVEFYREGCGYCQLLEPIYEKLAGKMKHLVRVAAVNTEREGRLASQFRINGVPTLKIFTPDMKVPKPGLDYQGERTVKAIKAFLVQHMPSYVTNVVSTSFPKFRSQSELGKVLVFSKNRTPTPLVKALSTQYRDRLEFGLVPAADTQLMRLLNVTSAPAVVFVPPVSRDAGSDVADSVVYEGMIKFRSLDNFLYKYARQYPPAKKGKKGKKKKGKGKASKAKREL